MRCQQLRAARHTTEEILAEPRRLDAGEIVRRNDLIGIDVGTVQRQHAACDDRHIPYGTRCGAHPRASAPPTRSSPGEPMRPSTALAATTAGDARCTRPPAPMRPGKLRFDDEMQRAPGASTPIDMPRQGPHDEWV